MSLTWYMTLCLLFLLFLAFHSYVLYPIVIKFISLLKRTESYPAIIPRASVVISAFNEEKIVCSRIEQIAEQNYDLSKIEVLIGSDNSTDSTNSILMELERKYPWLKVFIFDRRRGKAAVLNDIIKHAQNEILIFSDANTEFDHNAFRRLLGGFSDEKVGGICGRLILKEPLTNTYESIEEKKYWEYETHIKRSEGKCGVLIAANGGLFAIRRSLFEDIPADAVTDDLYITLSVLNKKYKFIFQEDAVAYEEVTTTIASEVKRKVRFAATNFQTLTHFRKLLFGKNILLAYAFWSHKVLRWFLPFILLSIIILNILLLDTSGLMWLLLSAQVVFYSIGLVGYVLSRMKVRISMFSMVFFFLVANIALCIGFLRFLRGKQSAIWQSTPR